MSTEPMQDAPSEASLPALRGDNELFVNRELSFLEFNQRIVQEAADPTVKLLERLKFIAIVSANLDEFFMVRVAGLKQQLKSGVLEAGPDGMLPSEQLVAILSRVSQQVAEQERALAELLPILRREGIGIYRVGELPEAARANLAERFERQLFPMLTPLAVDPGHPFPFLKNRTLNLAVHLVPERNPDTSTPLMAVVQVPQKLPRFVEVDLPGDLAVVFIDDLITHHVASLFPGMRILECIPFRVIRNWDLSFDESEQEDLLETVQKELRRRWRLDAVRLEISADASSELVDRLRGALGLNAADVQRHHGPLALGDFLRLQERIGRADLRDELFQPVLSPELRESEDIFAAVARGDILLHHPYESYEPVVELLRQAAQDPQVLAIKMTLYRTNHRDSPIVSALARAAENGKQVTALVELKARFDEEANVEWARLLEEAGVHVVYGLSGLKTHCKVTLLVRRESHGVRRYVHLGTGNYNEATAAVYSDLSFFTCRAEVCDDISALFNLLTGYSEPPAWRRLVVAPLGLRKRLLDFIEKTRDAARRGARAKIILKTNALIDPKIIRALCKASAAGADVTLLVRGPCGLRVGVPGASDKIVVRMIIDRFLEHSRIFYFAHDTVEDVFITSTDVMPRNFDRRIEVMLPIEEERLKRRIIDEVLAIELLDDTKAAVLQPDGTFQRLTPKEGRGGIRAQAEFMARARARARLGGKLGVNSQKKRRERRRP